jgi:hypothetical protein
MQAKQAFRVQGVCRRPTSRVVPKPNLDPLSPQVGEDEQVTRKGIEAERFANEAGQLIE